MEAEDTVGPAISLTSFEGPVLFNDEGFEIFETAGEEAGSVGSVVELAMEGAPSSSHGKQHWPGIEGMRAVELVESKCYRTPHGFQKEATFPCQTLCEEPSTSNFEDLVTTVPEQEEAQVALSTKMFECLAFFQIAVVEFCGIFIVFDKSPPDHSKSSR
ncbi:hypothetical protein OSTOST_13301 [Ostertagia ostertagi]